jgi:hypothetical protein
MMKRAMGATLAEIVDATGWQSKDELKDKEKEKLLCENVK